MFATVIAVAIAGMATRASAEQRLVARQSGGQIAFEVEGTGPVVLMIPSLGRGAADFDDLSRRLVVAGFTSVRPDPRGIGRSIGAMDGLTLHDLAGDAALAIEALMIERKDGQPVIVVGHAFGQRVGRTLAADRPELVKAMAMIAAGGKAPMKPGAAEALLGCFRLDRPDAERLADVKFAFFAPGNDRERLARRLVSRGRHRADRGHARDAGRGLVERGLSCAPAGDPGAAGHRSPARERPDDEGRAG